MSLELKEVDMAINNNLMLRTMFFINDEARHFLAPPLPMFTSDAEYFQKKSTPNSLSTTENVASNQTENNPPEKPVLLLPKQRPHVCEECGKTFLMKHHLTTHMRVHTGERPHVCPECGKSFALKHCLSTHLLLHTSDRPYKCPECSKTFTLKHHLVSHERVHSRERPFECTECGRRFPQKRHLTTHIKFHSGERPYFCEVCDESFSREEHLVMHSRFHGGQKPFICPDCGEGFGRKFELVNHERQHGRYPESCPMCGKEFLQKRTLLVHVRTCGLSAPTLPPPVQSADRDNSSNPDKTCKECGETFASKEGLALHMRLHFGDHSFLSDICSLAASLKQSAVNAALSLSLASKKTHICSDCGRGFTQKHGLFTHRQRHENGSCKLKPFSCVKCGKSFAQKNHLSLHERQHMDLPPRASLTNLLHSSQKKEEEKNKVKLDDSSEETEDSSSDNIQSTSNESIQRQNQNVSFQRNVLCSDASSENSRIQLRNQDSHFKKPDHSVGNSSQVGLSQQTKSKDFHRLDQPPQHDPFSNSELNRFLRQQSRAISNEQANRLSCDDDANERFLLVEPTLNLLSTDHQSHQNDHIVTEDVLNHHISSSSSLESQFQQSPDRHY